MNIYILTYFLYFNMLSAQSLTPMLSDLYQFQYFFFIIIVHTL
jgi:ABC-type uncharacterized transport system involved in gliding motility auxiliary subunit